MFEFLLLLSVLAGIVIEPFRCESIQTVEPKCLMHLDEVRKVLSSTVPPINDSRMTDNYYNISRALYPSIDLPSLYVKVTFKFLKDYQNGSKWIDDKMEKKLTWSHSCSYVSVKDISLYAMSVFSLFTIYPQRRTTELTLTVPPFCKGSPYARDNEARSNETWKYIVSMLQDIVINPRAPDPRLSIASCVVIGHEGDIDEYPKLHYFCWFILVTSFLVSLSIWFVLHFWIPNSFTKDSTDKSRLISGAILKLPFAVILVFTIINLVCHFVSSCKANDDIFICLYVYVYLGMCFATFVIGCIFNCCIIKCCRNYCTYKFGSCLLFPCVFHTVHYFLWVMSGIISEPFWAFALFLLECLCLASILYFLYHYESEFAKKATGQNELIFKLRGSYVNNLFIFIHMVWCLLSFFSLLITIAVMAIGNGNAVNSPIAGAIESTMIAILFWLARNCNFDFWFKNKDEAETGV